MEGMGDDEREHTRNGRKQGSHPNGTVGISHLDLAASKRSSTCNTPPANSFPNACYTKAIKLRCCGCMVYLGRLKDFFLLYSADSGATESDRELYENVSPFQKRREPTGSSDQVQQQQPHQKDIPTWTTAERIEGGMKDEKLREAYLDDGTTHEHSAALHRPVPSRYPIFY